jgi:hypothetical protein
MRPLGIAACRPLYHDLDADLKHVLFRYPREIRKSYRNFAHNAEDMPEHHREV